MTAQWQEYLAAAQRLDAVRRTAADPQGRPMDPALAAREELARVRTRLAVQHARLRALGVPESELRPTGAELTAVATPMAKGPEAVLAGLRQARTTTETAESRLAGDARPVGGWRRVRDSWLDRLAASGGRSALLLLVPVLLVGLTVLVCLGIAALTLLG